MPENDDDFRIVNDGEDIWRSNKIILGKIRELDKVETWEYLMERGAKITNDFPFLYVIDVGHIEVVRYLVETIFIDLMTVQ